MLHISCLTLFTSPLTLHFSEKDSYRDRSMRIADFLVRLDVIRSR